MLTGNTTVMVYWGVMYAIEELGEGSGGDGSRRPHDGEGPMFDGVAEGLEVGGGASSIGFFSDGKIYMEGRARTDEILANHLLELSEGDGIDVQLPLKVLACPPQPEHPPSDDRSKPPLR